jgi:hypothetical protein
MKEFKKGSRFMQNANQCEILDRDDYLTLTKVTMSNGGVYYDISKVLSDGDGREHFQLSPNANGLLETIVGSQKTPKSLAEMQIKFNTLTEDLATSRRSTAESQQSNDERTVTRARRIWEVKANRDEARSALAAEVNNGKPLSLVLKSKKTQQLAAEIMAAEMILTVIR